MLSEDEVVDGGDSLEWSSEVEQAAWIADLLSPFGSGVVTSVVPAGFEAYARLLHPVEDPGRGGRQVRWAEVAAWSGVPLVAGGQFHEIALPEHEPVAPAPWRGQGPPEGTLSAEDAAVLIEVLAGHTTTPERCWFCLWDGYGWDHAVYLSAVDDPGADVERPPDPVPAVARANPRVRLPGRAYLLYAGPIAAAMAFVDSQHQTPNLWWPSDRAWCVASEIDLPWTYVGGSADLVDRLVAGALIEAQRASPGESHHQRVGGWLGQVIEKAVAELMDSSNTIVETSRGTVRADLQRPSRWQRGCLHASHDGRNGVTGASTWMLDDRDADRLRSEVSHYLTAAVIGLVDG